MTTKLTFNEKSYELRYYTPNGIPSFAVYINDELTDYYLELINGTGYFKCFQLIHKGLWRHNYSMVVENDTPSFKNVSKIISRIESELEVKLLYK